MKRTSYFYLLATAIICAVVLNAQKPYPKMTTGPGDKNRYFLVGYIAERQGLNGFSNGILDAICPYFPPHDTLINLIKTKVDHRFNNIHIISISELSKEDNQSFWGKK